MVSNSAQLDRRTKQHTQFGASESNGSRDMGRTKSWRKKIEKKEKEEKNERQQSHIASPTGIANNSILSLSTISKMIMNDIKTSFTHGDFLATLLTDFVALYSLKSR